MSSNFHYIATNYEINSLLPEDFDYMFKYGKIIKDDNGNFSVIVNDVKYEFILKTTTPHSIYKIGKREILLYEDKIIKG